MPRCGWHCMRLTCTIMTLLGTWPGSSWMMPDALTIVEMLWLVSWGWDDCRRVDSCPAVTAFPAVHGPAGSTGCCWVTPAWLTSLWTPAASALMRCLSAARTLPPWTPLCWEHHGMCHSSSTGWAGQPAAAGPVVELLLQVSLLLRFPMHNLLKLQS